MCSLVVNGVPHGPDRGTTVCQLHMRRFKDGDTITIEPWRAKAFPVVKDLVVDRSAFDRIIAAGGYVSVNAGGAPDGNAILIPKDVVRSGDGLGGVHRLRRLRGGVQERVGAPVHEREDLAPRAAAAGPGRSATAASSAMIDQADAEGFGSCSNEGECEAVCPKEIPISNIARMTREYVKARLGAGQVAPPRMSATSPIGAMGAIGIALATVFLLQRRFGAPPPAKALRHAGRAAGIRGLSRLPAPRGHLVRLRAHWRLGAAADAPLRALRPEQRRDLLHDHRLPVLVEAARRTRAADRLAPALRLALLRLAPLFVFFVALLWVIALARERLPAPRVGAARRARHAAVADVHDRGDAEPQPRADRDRRRRGVVASVRVVVLSLVAAGRRRWSAPRPPAPWLALGVGGRAGGAWWVSSAAAGQSRPPSSAGSRPRFWSRQPHVCAAARHPAASHRLSRRARRGHPVRDGVRAGAAAAARRSRSRSSPAATRSSACSTGRRRAASARWATASTCCTPSCCSSRSELMLGAAEPPALSALAHWLGRLRVRAGRRRPELPHVPADRSAGDGVVDRVNARGAQRRRGPELTTSGLADPADRRVEPEVGDELQFAAGGGVGLPQSIDAAAELVVGQDGQLRREAGSTTPSASASARAARPRCDRPPSTPSTRSRPAPSRRAASGRARSARDRSRAFPRSTRRPTTRRARVCGSLPMVSRPPPGLRTRRASAKNRSRSAK